MPRVRKRGKRRTAYTEQQRAILRNGRDYFGDLPDPAAAWDALRDEILPAFIAEHPGRRPWAWWLFDMPPKSRRERIDGETHPHDRRTGYVDPERRLHFGKPSRIQEADRHAIYESQEAFLRRHRLLSDAEKSALDGE